MLKKEHKKFLDTFLPEYNPDSCTCEISTKVWDKLSDEVGVSFIECLDYLDVRHERISK